MAAGTIGTDFATATAITPPPPLWRRLLSYRPMSRSNPSSRARHAGNERGTVSTRHNEVVAATTRHLTESRR